MRFTGRDRSDLKMTSQQYIVINLFLFYMPGWTVASAVIKIYNATLDTHIAVARTLFDGRDAYSCLHVVPDEFHFK